MMIRTALLIPLVAVLLSCGLFTPSATPTPVVHPTVTVGPGMTTGDRILETPHLAGDTSAETAGSFVESPTLPPDTDGEPTPEVVHTVTAPVVRSDYVESPLAGDTSIEEKIIKNNVVVRATMTSVTSEVLLITDNRYRTVLKFNLTVSEYLMGSGPTNIVAVWVDSRSGSYETSSEADARKAVILARRDAQWDDREAIIFLHDGASGYGTLLDEQLQRANHFILALGGRYGDDRYSLHSESSRDWLPAVSPATGTGDAKQFLLAVPPTSKTITLGNLKKQITKVTAEYSGGDGSEAYKECVVGKYEWLRNQRNWPEEEGGAYSLWDLGPSIPSGQPAGTVFAQLEAYGDYPDDGTRITNQVAGTDAALFSTANGAATSVDKNGDGVFDQITFDMMVKVARPLAAGEYGFELQESWPGYAICDFVISNHWTVTVTSPAGVLHELLFDPVTVGSAVTADSTNGVLKPATFTDGDGVSATVESISYEAGEVKVKIVPWSVLSGKIVDFIELDGRTSVTLNVTNSAVETASNTLTWSVSSQPWEDGDKLMVRIRSR